jgi:hypothetical protein
LGFFAFAKTAKGSKSAKRQRGISCFIVLLKSLKLFRRP